VSYTIPPPNPPPSTQSGYTWQNQGPNNQFACLDNGTTIPFASVANGQPAPAGTAVVGPNPYPNTYQLVGPNGTPVGPVQQVCPNVVNLPATAAPPPPPPPPPPSAAEVWAETPLPANHIEFSPATLGLTQLPTWIWFTGTNGAIHATVNIRGYTVTTTASPVAAYWTFGDGRSGQGAVGGSAAQPSVTHTYANIGHYTVTLIVAWSGQYTFAGNGAPTQTVALGTVDGPTTAAPYAVQEVRSVGIQPASNS
jgi:hypothetical protein